jgi:tetratricopeptide (TPR) repeat protein
MSDRFAYVPLIGLFIVIAWGVPDLVVRWHYREIKLATIIVALLAILMATTYLQVGYWKNSITLFKHALDVTYNNHIAHHKLGEALAVQGKTAAAARHYTEALRIKPDFFATHLNLGIILRSEGKLNEAIGHISKVISQKPDYAEAHNELGIALSEQGNYDSAIKHYLKALKIKTDYASAHNNIGIALSRQGNDKKAISHFYEALRIDSSYSNAYFNLGNIFASQEKIKEAILYYRKAIHYSPNMAIALYNLSWISASHINKKFRNGEEAIELAEKLCKITRYNQPLALDVLAAAYAETGKFNEAVVITKKAIELALKKGSQKLALVLKKRLQLYQAGRPYRQTHNKKGNS